MVGIDASQDFKMEASRMGVPFLICYLKMSTCATESEQLAVPVRDLSRPLSRKSRLHDEVITAVLCVRVLLKRLVRCVFKIRIVLNVPETVNQVELSVVCDYFYIGSILTRAF